MVAKKLEGQTAIVTGAARGLGRVIAHHLSHLGANVVINDINLKSAEEYGEQLTAEGVDAECRALGGNAIAVQADMRNLDDAKHVIQRTLEVFGRVDILVNNAGGMLAPMENSYASSVPIDEYQDVIDTNLKTVVCGCQAVVPVMKQAGGGRIVNLTSQAAVRVRLNGSLSQYSIAKAAISHYTRILAAEVGPYKIHVNAVAPGLILTSRAVAQGRADEPFKSNTESLIPLRRMGTPEDVAKAVEFFVSDLSNYVTGQVLSVCGGNVLQAS